MSRQCKPEGTDVLHYRFYRSNPQMEQYDLMPNGGITLAVQWPDEDWPLVRIGIARCSYLDAFVRRIGYDKAVGRLLSSSCWTGAIVEDSSAPCPQQFVDKCAVLNSAIYHDLNGIQDVIFGHVRWGDEIAEIVTPLRSHSPSVSLLDSLRPVISPDIVLGPCACTEVYSGCNCTIQT